MKIALPLTAGEEFAEHYGAAEQFVVYDIEPRTRTVRRRIQVRPEEKRPCQWPVLLRTAGADVVLAGGMGQGARQRMEEFGLTVVTGVASASPDALIAGWLDETIAIGENACRGGHHHHDGTGPCHGHDHGHGATPDHESGCGCSG